MTDEKKAEKVDEKVPGAPVTPPTNHDIYGVAAETVVHSPEFAEVDEKEMVDEELKEDGLSE